MAALSKSSWWLLALGGVAAIVLGVLTAAWPGITVVVLMVLFGVLAFVHGVFAVGGSLLNREAYKHWWLMLLGGLASIVVGILVFAWPGITALVLLYLIAAWALLIGIVSIIIAIRMRKEIKSAWMPILIGIISVAFGIVAFAWPIAGALTIVWLIALFAISFGILLLALAHMARSERKQSKQIEEQEHGA